MDADSPLRSFVMPVLAAMIIAALLALGGQKTITQAPSIDQLRNATFTGINGGPVTLKDGLYEGQPLTPAGSARTRVGLLPGTLVTGDLDGGGAPEAVVLLWKASGGTGVLTYVAVVSNKSGRIQNIATALVGDRQQVQSLSIADKRIVINIVGHGPGEPMCCPTQKQRRTWELMGVTLKERPTQVLGTVSLADLEGKTWTLKSFDSDTLVPAGVTVTLNVTNGRVSGNSGCNSYNGSITAGDAARALKIGPLAATRMFCSGAGSEVETRYLAALQAAVQFSFNAGDLALTYRDGDATRTLMHSGR